MISATLGYSVTAFLLWGLWGIFAKHAVEHRSTASALFVSYLTSLALIGIQASGFSRHFRLDVGFAFAVLSGLAMGLGTLFFYRSLAIEQLAIAAAIPSLYFVIPTLYGAVVLNESFKTVNALGVVLAGVAIVLLTR